MEVISVLKGVLSLQPCEERNARLLYHAFVPHARQYISCLYLRTVRAHVVPLSLLYLPTVVVIQHHHCPDAADPPKYTVPLYESTVLCTIATFTPRTSRRANHTKEIVVLIGDFAKRPRDIDNSWNGPDGWRES